MSGFLKKRQFKYSFERYCSISLFEKKRFGISVLTIDPGNVKTNMNNKGFLNTEKCSEYLVDIVSENIDYNGAFINLLKNINQLSYQQ